MEVRMPSPLLAVVAALLCGPCRLVAAYASPKTLEKTWTVEFELGPGEIYNEWIDLPMPEGKFVIEAFNADIVDRPTEAPCCNTPESVPLTDVYLHHWTVNVFNVTPEIRDYGARLEPSGSVGPCQEWVYHQIFGVGSEARNTNTTFPKPYGLVFDLAENQQWVTNIHAIDTRLVRDVRGCIECSCEETGVDTSQWEGSRKNYQGGLECCHSTRTQNARCRLARPLDGNPTDWRKKYYMRYTVRWRLVDECTVPLEVMVLDVTDTSAESWTHQHMGVCAGGAEGGSTKCAMGCMVEYSLPACNPFSGPLAGCVHSQRRDWSVPFDMDLVFMYGHQHFGGLGVTLFREGDPLNRICDSLPMYGHGHSQAKAGHESGYVTGMTSCTFQEGIPLKAGDALSMTSTYLLDGRPHTGVMGLWYVAFVNKTAAQSRPSYCPGLQSHYSGGLWSWLTRLGHALRL